MRIAICDDNFEDLKVIIKYIEEFCDNYSLDWELDSYLDYKKFLDAVDLYDAVILDVILGDIIGIDVARRIRLDNNEIKIIFCSTSHEYSLDAFGVQGFRYIVKPINKKILFSYLDDLSNIFHEFEIEIKDIERNIRKISISNILYIEMDRRISKVVLNTEIIKVYKTMKEWKQILDNFPFCICHKGVIANLKHVKHLDDNKIIMKNGDNIYLSRSCKSVFTNTYYEYLDSLL